MKVGWMKRLGVGVGGNKLYHPSAYTTRMQPYLPIFCNKNKDRNALTQTYNIITYSAVTEKKKDQVQ